MFSLTVQMTLQVYNFNRTQLHNPIQENTDRRFVRPMIQEFTEAQIIESPKRIGRGEESVCL